MATVSLEAASYGVPERQGVLQINITRSGNLQNTSVILVATDDFQGTASGKVIKILTYSLCNNVSNHPYIYSQRRLHFSI